MTRKKPNPRPTSAKTVRRTRYVTKKNTAKFKYKVKGSRGAVYKTTTLKEARKMAGQSGTISKIGGKKRNPQPSSFALYKRAGEWTTGFFQRHPALRRYQTISVVPKETEGTESASQQGGKIAIYPRFWEHPPGLQDQIFAHEIGHWVLSRYGMSCFIELAEEHGAALRSIQHGRGFRR